MATEITSHVRHEIDEAQLAAVARALASAVQSGGVIHLRGDLGAGKTTFARALISALGVESRVKSPTYSLIESYESNGLEIMHLDLYRIAHPDEMEWLGLRDHASERRLWLIEWPERGGATIPRPDLIVHLAHAGARRDLRFEAMTPFGRDWLKQPSLAQLA